LFQKFKFSTIERKWKILSGFKVISSKFSHHKFLILLSIELFSYKIYHHFLIDLEYHIQFISRYEWFDRIQTFIHCFNYNNFSLHFFNFLNFQNYINFFHKNIIRYCRKLFSMFNGVCLFWGICWFYWFFNQLFAKNCSTAISMFHKFYIIFSEFTITIIIFHRLFLSFVTSISRVLMRKIRLSI